MIGGNDDGNIDGVGGDWLMGPWGIEMDDVDQITDVWCMMFDDGVWITWLILRSGIEIHYI